ncbi:MAG TPA: hypothetical protein VGH05_14320 [Buttiauxella sp.]|jgi:hypothetical protein
MSKSQQLTANCKQKFSLKLLKIRHMPNPAAAPEFALSNTCNDGTYKRHLFLKFASAVTVAPLKCHGFSVTLKPV